MLAHLFKPTNLWAAAKKGNVKAIEALVAAGHDPNAKKTGFFREGYTPLHIAVLHRRKDAIGALVKLGANVNAKNKEGETPLSIAVTRLDNPDVADLLADMGAKINTKLSGLAMTPLDLAAFYNKPQMVGMLLEKGATPNVGRGETRSDPIGACAHHGNVEILKMLLAAGADVNALYYGHRAISSAAVRGHLPFVKALLEAGADPNSPEQSGTTPLMSAVAGGNIELVKLLVQAGAKLDAVRFSGEAETALDFAEWRSRKKTKPMAEFLRSIGAKRASELPASETTPPPETENETFWQLSDDSVLTVRLDPWPPKEGVAKLKAELSTNGYDPTLPFSRTLEFRMAPSEQSSEPWTTMRRGRKDDDNNVLFSQEVTLSKGTTLLQFRVHPKWEKEASVPEGWKLDVS